MKSLGFYGGIPVYIATKEFQRRKHHKKRVNKAESEERMKRAELMKLVGKNVRVLFFDGKWIWGKLGYADEFSAKHDFRKPNYFYIGNISFKVSHIKKVVESEEV